MPSADFRNCCTDTKNCSFSRWLTQHYRGFLLNQTFVDFRQKINDTAVHYSRMMAQKTSNRDLAYPLFSSVLLYSLKWLRTIL